MPYTDLIIIGYAFELNFQHHTNLCIDQQIQFNCTVLGSGYGDSSQILLLTWKILTDTGVQMGYDVTYISSTNEVNNENEDFKFRRISKSPLVSSVSFPAILKYNGYAIICLGEEQDGQLQQRKYTIKGILLLSRLKAVYIV